MGASDGAHVIMVSISRGKGLFDIESAQIRGYIAESFEPSFSLIDARLMALINPPHYFCREPSMALKHFLFSDARCFAYITLLCFRLRADE